MQLHMHLHVYAHCVQRPFCRVAGWAPRVAVSCTIGLRACRLKSSITSAMSPSSEGVRSRQWVVMIGLRTTASSPSQASRHPLISPILATAGPLALTAISASKARAPAPREARQS